MTKLSEVASVPLPVKTTEENILRYLESRRRDGTIVIPLRVSLQDFGLPDDLRIERDVSVRVEKRRDAENINEEIAIGWIPTDEGPFPSFTGRLIVWSEEDLEKSFVQLEGSYEAPLGTAGKAFDAAIGWLIAKRTAQTFLNNLRDAAIALQRLGVNAEGAEAP
jgi:hypothetical protein